MDSKSFLAALNPGSMVVKPSHPVKLKDFDPSFTGDFSKKAAQELLQQSVEELASYQNVLYAQNTYAPDGLTEVGERLETS